MSLPLNPQPEKAVAPPELVATVKALQAALPALGSTANINRMIVMQDGLPYRRLGGRLLFSIPEVTAWMLRHPGHNLPEAC